jgi:hypothetical protein
MVSDILSRLMTRLISSNMEGNTYYWSYPRFLDNLYEVEREILFPALDRLREPSAGPEHYS